MKTIMGFLAFLLVIGCGEDNPTKPIATAPSLSVVMGTYSIVYDDPYSDSLYYQVRFSVLNSGNAAALVDEASLKYIRKGGAENYISRQDGPEQRIVGGVTYVSHLIRYVPCSDRTENTLYFMFPDSLNSIAVDTLLFGQSDC